MLWLNGENSECTLFLNTLKQKTMEEHDNNTNDDGERKKKARKCLISAKNKRAYSRKKQRLSTKENERRNYKRRRVANSRLRYFIFLQLKKDKSEEENRILFLHEIRKKKKRISDEKRYTRKTNKNVYIDNNVTNEISNDGGGNNTGDANNSPGDNSNSDDSDDSDEDSDDSFESDDIIIGGEVESESEMNNVDQELVNTDEEDADNSNTTQQTSIVHRRIYRGHRTSSVRTNESNEETNDEIEENNNETNDTEENNDTSENVGGVEETNNEIEENTNDTNNTEENNDTSENSCVEYQNSFDGRNFTGMPNYHLRDSFVPIAIHDDAMIGYETNQINRFREIMTFTDVNNLFCRLRSSEQAVYIGKVLELTSISEDTLFAYFVVINDQESSRRKVCLLSLNNLPKCKWGNIKKSDEFCDFDICSICQEDGSTWNRSTEVVKLYCGHFYCIECIFEATCHNSQCALCRKEITQIES